MPFLELGYCIVLISFGQMVVVAVLLILLPLLRLGLPGRTRLKRWTIPFFSGLGLGYMFFEIMLIHELVLFFGHPIFAAAAGISSLLIFSGLGSLISGHLLPSRSGHGLAAALVALILLLYLFILPPLLHMAITLSTVWKTLFFLLLIAPPAVAMGMPFPLALARVKATLPDLVPWCWAINGCTSVLAAVLATLLAMTFGTQAVVLIAVALYALAGLALIGVPPGRKAHSPL
jgi:hypothetical protein